MMEDVKHEQMLMLTFSRAAATEFKKRLMTLIGNAANFIQITTFHSYCFDLLGKVGDIEKSDKIVNLAVDKINSGEVDFTRLTKTVLVIDEAQDMSAAEFSLVKTLMDKNEDMRVIAVGDDDQNIYEFRGSSSAYLESLMHEPGAKKYELVENYRSNSNIIDLANQFANKISHRLKSIPIISKKKENGTIITCNLVSQNIAIPVVNAVLDKKPSGSTCIVTRTNDEALNIVGLLLQNGITARQIQTNNKITGNDFSLYNLVELRDFINDIDIVDNSYAISEDVWEHAKHNLNNKYEGSENLPGTLKLIRGFEETNNKTKYKSDFKQYVRESKLEDFISDEEGAILVSTIHQTKGREFDNLFLALSKFPKMDDGTKRSIYVAITRAKINLYMYYCGEYFDKLCAENMQKLMYNNYYPEPDRIILHLSHEDVWLDYFIYSQSDIGALKSGNLLSIREAACFWGDKQVIKFSSKFNERIESLKLRGYLPIKAIVRHMVYWQGKDKEKEVKIILPNVEFEKKDK